MKPKYQIGDEVFRIDDAKIVKETVTGVALTYDFLDNNPLRPNRFYYGFRKKAFSSEVKCFCEESLLFPSKKELIKSL